MTAKLNEHIADEIYKRYIADSLYYQGHGKVLTTMYNDLIDPKPVDNRSGDEVAMDVINKLGLKYVGDI